MNKAHRRQKKRETRVLKGFRREEIYFLGHHTRPRTKYKTAIDWHFACMRVDFKKAYGKYADNIYKDSAAPSLIHNSFDFCGKVISIPISFENGSELTISEEPPLAFRTRAR